MRKVRYTPTESGNIHAIGQDLTSGSITRNIWRLAIPMMLGNLLHNAFNFVNMIFVGRLGPDAIAAVTMGGLILFMVFTFGMSISVGTIAIVARCMGAGKPTEVENVTIQSLLLGAIGSAAIGCAGYLLAGDILRLLGADIGVIQTGIPYLRIMFLGLPAIFFSLALGAALRGVGDALTPMKMLVGSTVFNIVLDPLLIFGLLGFPRLGVSGAAVATVFTRGCGVLYMLWKCSSGRGFFTLHLRNTRLDWNIMKNILKIGVFGSIQVLLRNVSIVVLMRIVAIYGTATVAGYGIGMQLQMIAMIPAVGIGNAVATLVGQNLGAGKPKRAEQTTKQAAILSLSIVTVIGIGYILFAGPLIRIFNSDAAVVRQGALFVHVTAGVLGFFGISMSLGRAFNGAGDTIPSAMIAVISLFLLRIPLALGGAYLWNEFGLFMGITVTTVLQALLMIFWFRRGHWKYKQVGSEG